MRKLVTALLATLPLLAAAQDSAQPPGPPAQPAPAQYAPPPPQPQPTAAPQDQPPQYPPGYVPPPQYTPQPPQGQSAPPQYPPPPHRAQPPPYSPPQAPPYRRPDRQRDSWYIGFGLGGGSGRADLGDRTVHFSELVFADATTLSLNFRVGATLTPRLLLGADFGTVGASGEEGGFSSTAQANYYDVGIMYFPLERGPFLRAAAGLSRFVQHLESIGDFSAGGYNVLGGLGYAFWLGRAFNLTLNLDVQRHWFNEGLDGATTMGFWLGFDWY